MRQLVYSMLERLNVDTSGAFIPWAAPIPSFGDLEHAKVATLGINPSNREFLDSYGTELSGKDRRFHTLNSLNISNWGEANDKEIQAIAKSCTEYFWKNPYRQWFDRLGPIVGATGCSYYDRFNPACHIDLIPFATACKWTELTFSHRRRLLSDNCDLLRQIIHSSRLNILILNGKSVVSEFETLAGIQLKAQKMDDWSLPRYGRSDVMGFAYSGVCSQIGRLPLDWPILVFGFNHNIQSSFGVTKRVVYKISTWIAQQVHLHDRAAYTSDRDSRAASYV